MAKPVRIEATVQTPPAKALTGLDDPELREQYAALSKDELISLLCERRPEGVNLVFAGKGNARRIARKVRPRAQVIVSDLSVGSGAAQAQNLLLEGENLQGMVSLYKYHGSVDFILTDPPYNTGNDFRYNDKWDDDPNDPDPGDLVTLEDNARLTKWMKFMLPRLQMMHALLKPTGVLAICIDHRELFRLGLMLNEVFREENRIGIINWQKTYSSKKTRHLSTATEYVLIYAKDLDRAKTGLLPRDAAMNNRYSNVDGDPEGDWTGDNVTASEFRRPTVYAIQSPFTGAIHYPEGIHSDGDDPGEATHHWRLSRKDMKLHLEQWGSRYEERDLGDKRGNALVLRGSKVGLSGYDPAKDPAVARAKRRALQIRDKGSWPALIFLEGDEGPGSGRPRLKRYFSNIAKGRIPWTFWADDDYETPLIVGSQSWSHTESGHSQVGLKELDAIVGKKHGFQTVKPLRLFKKLIQLWCPPRGVVVDPFAGSGTSGHAILDLNKETGAQRTFVLIEEGRVENADRYARTLTAKRLKNVITGRWAEGHHEGLGDGFRFCSLKKKVDAKAVLAMERDEMIDLLISSHWDRDGRNRPFLEKVRGDYRHLIAVDPERFGYFLLWQGAQDTTTLNSKTHTEILKEAAAERLKAPYNVYARYEDYQAADIRFFKIPDRILIHLGLNDARDAYNEDSEQPS